MARDVLSARVVHMQCGQRSAVSITADLPHPVKFFNVVRQACGGYVVKLQSLSTYPRQARQSQAWVTGVPGKARLSTPSRCGQASYPRGVTGGAVALRRPQARRSATKGTGPLIGLLRLRPRRVSEVHDGSVEEQGSSKELAGMQRAMGQGLAFPPLNTHAASEVHDGSVEEQGSSKELAGMQRATGRGLTFPPLNTRAASEVHDGSVEEQGSSKELAGMQRAMGQGLAFPPLNTHAASEVHDGSVEEQGSSKELAGMQRATGRGLTFPPLIARAASEVRGDSFDSWGRYDS